MGNLKGFLVDLALNADVMRSYSEDPQGTLDKAGLSADERAAVLSGDSARMRAALGRPDNDCMSQTAVKMRSVATRRALNVTGRFPLGVAVTLPAAVEITLKDGTVQSLPAGSTLTRCIKRRPRRKPGGGKKAATVAKSARKR